MWGVQTARTNQPKLNQTGGGRDVELKAPSLPACLPACLPAYLPVHRRPLPATIIPPTPPVTEHVHGCGGGEQHSPPPPPPPIHPPPPQPHHPHQHIYPSPTPTCHSARPPARPRSRGGRAAAGSGSMTPPPKQLPPLPTTPTTRTPVTEHVHQHVNGRRGREQQRALALELGVPRQAALLQHGHHLRVDQPEGGGVDGVGGGGA